MNIWTLLIMMYNMRGLCTCTLGIKVIYNYIAPPLCTVITVWRCKNPFQVFPALSTLEFVV